MRTGSLINKLMDESGDAAKPEVGMGCTLTGWTDRHAATIIQVSPTGHKIWVQRDKATRTDSNGMSDAQTWEFEPDPTGAVGVYSRRSDGSYRQVGGQSRCLVGVRSEYFDFSF